MWRACDILTIFSLNLYNSWIVHYYRSSEMTRCVLIPYFKYLFYYVEAAVNSTIKYSYFSERCQKSRSGLNVVFGRHGPTRMFYCPFFCRNKHDLRVVTVIYFMVVPTSSLRSDGMSRFSIEPFSSHREKV